jgi:hypothetical protein
MNPEIEKLASMAERNETSLFQITYFLIGQEPTDQAKLHKCITEMSGRVRSIKALNTELAEITDTVELLTLELAKLPSDTKESVIKKRMLNRKIQNHVDQAEKLEAKRSGWEKELEYLHQIYKAIAAYVPLKPWGSYDVQLEYWDAKFRHEIAIRDLSGLSIDIETVKAINALPENAPLRKELMASSQQAISAKEDR